MGNKLNVRFHKILTLPKITKNKISFMKDNRRKSDRNSTPILTDFRKAEEPYKMHQNSVSKR